MVASMNKANIFDDTKVALYMYFFMFLLLGEAGIFAMKAMMKGMTPINFLAIFSVFIWLLLLNSAKDLKFKSQSAPSYIYFTFTMCQPLLLYLGLDSNQVNNHLTISNFTEVFSNLGFGESIWVILLPFSVFIRLSLFHY